MQHAGAAVETEARPVVLLHGLGRTSASMYLLARRLRRAGLDAGTLAYPSTRLSLEAACEFVRRTLNERFPTSRIDMVGHSMGGVIARRICLSAEPPDVRRVVQIGAPNLGSPLADRLGPLWAVRTACGPAIEDLQATDDRLHADPRVTAIAGTYSTRTMHGPNDGAVPVRSAWAGAAHRHRVRRVHTLLPMSAAVARIVIAALKHDAEPACS